MSMQLFEHQFAWWFDASVEPDFNALPGEGLRGICALTSVANLLTQFCKPTTEGDVVRRASVKSRRWWDGGAWWREVNDAGWKVTA